jgi:hypothetical protein
MSERERTDLDIVLEHLSVVRLEPGDKIVLRAPEKLTVDAVRNVREAALNAFGEAHEVLVLSGGMEMSVLRPQPEAPQP